MTKPMDDVGVTFVNDILSYGELNGVANITFGTLLFTPTDDGKISPDMVVSARLRMDAQALQALHVALSALIERMTEVSAGPVVTETTPPSVKAKVKALN